MDEGRISLFPLNGRKDVFEKRLREGYTGIAFGNGDWVGSERSVILWVFYHPDGRIATYEPLRLKRINGFTMPGTEVEIEHTEESFREYVKRRRIKIGERTSLAEFFVRWENDTSCDNV